MRRMRAQKAIRKSLANSRLEVGRITENNNVHGGLIQAQKTLVQGCEDEPLPLRVLNLIKTYINRYCMITN